MLVERIFVGRPANYAIMVARINGSFTSSQLRKILPLLRKKHPLLATRIRFDEENYAWLTNENVPEIPIVVIECTKENQWIEIVKEEHKYIFPLEKGPLIRFVLLKKINSLDLIVNSHHSICDGLSLAYLIRDILFYLANPKEEIKTSLFSPPLNRKNIPFKAKRNDKTNFMIKAINKIWMRKERRFTKNDYENLTEIFWTKNSCEITAWQLDEFQTSLFLKTCKKERVTVNTAIITAFLTTQTKFQNNNIKSKKRVHIPINIRNRLTVPIGEAFGFYAQTLILNLKYNQKKNFWDLSRSLNNIIHTEIKKKNSIFNLFKVAKLNPSLLDSSYYYKYGMFDNKLSALLLKGMGANDSIADLSITNIGYLDFPNDFGDLSLKALYGPSVYSDLLNFIVGVATVGNKLNFILTFDDKIISKDMIIKIKRFFMDLLGKLCDW